IADRKFNEEVSYCAHDLQLLNRVNLSPAYMEHGINIVLARDLYPERLSGDEPEPIEVVPYPFKGLLSLVARPDFCEGRSIAALSLAREWVLANGSHCTGSHADGVPGGTGAAGGGGHHGGLQQCRPGRGA